MRQLVVRDHPEWRALELNLLRAGHCNGLQLAYDQHDRPAEVTLMMHKFNASGYSDLLRRNQVPQVEDLLLGLLRHHPSNNPTPQQKQTLLSLIPNSTSKNPLERVTAWDKRFTAHCAALRPWMPDVSEELLFDLYCNGMRLAHNPSWQEAEREHGPYVPGRVLADQLMERRATMVQKVEASQKKAEFGKYLQAMQPAGQASAQPGEQHAAPRPSARGTHTGRSGGGSRALVVYDSQQSGNRPANSPQPAATAQQMYAAAPPTNLYAPPWGYFPNMPYPTGPYPAPGQQYAYATMATPPAAAVPPAQPSALRAPARSDARAPEFRPRREQTPNCGYCGLPHTGNECFIQFPERAPAHWQGPTRGHRDAYLLYVANARKARISEADIFPFLDAGHVLHTPEEMLPRSARGGRGSGPAGRSGGRGRSAPASTAGRGRDSGGRTTLHPTANMALQQAIDAEEGGPLAGIYNLSLMVRSTNSPPPANAPSSSTPSLYCHPNQSKAARQTQLADYRKDPFRTNEECQLDQLNAQAIEQVLLDDRKAEGQSVAALALDALVAARLVAIEQGAAEETAAARSASTSAAIHAGLPVTFSTALSGAAPAHEIDTPTPVPYSCFSSTGPYPMYATADEHAAAVATHHSAQTATAAALPFGSNEPDTDVALVSTRFQTRSLEAGAETANTAAAASAPLATTLPATVPNPPVSESTAASTPVSPVTPSARAPSVPLSGPPGPGPTALVFPSAAGPQAAINSPILSQSAPPPPPPRPQQQQETRLVTNAGPPASGQRTSKPAGRSAPPPAPKGRGAPRTAASTTGRARAAQPFLPYPIAAGIPPSQLPDNQRGGFPGYATNGEQLPAPAAFRLAPPVLAPPILAPATAPSTARFAVVKPTAPLKNIRYLLSQGPMLAEAAIGSYGAILVSVGDKWLSIPLDECMIEQSDPVTRPASTSQFQIPFPASTAVATVPVPSAMPAQHTSASLPSSQPAPSTQHPASHFVGQPRHTCGYCGQAHPGPDCFLQSPERATAHWKGTPKGNADLYRLYVSNARAAHVPECNIRHYLDADNRLHSAAAMLPCSWSNTPIDSSHPASSSAATAPPTYHLSGLADRAPEQDAASPLQAVPKARSERSQQRRSKYLAARAAERAGAEPPPQPINPAHGQPAAAARAAALTALSGASYPTLSGDTALRAHAVSILPTAGGAPSTHAMPSHSPSHVALTGRLTLEDERRRKLSRQRMGIADRCPGVTPVYFIPNCDPLNYLNIAELGTGRTANSWKIAVLDSGADVTLCSQEYADRNGLSYGANVMEFHVAGGGSTITTLGELDNPLEFTLAAATRSACAAVGTVQVVANTGSLYDLIISTEIINQWGAHAAFPTSQIVWHPHWWLDNGDSRITASLPMWIRRRYPDADGSRRLRPPTGGAGCAVNLHSARLPHRS